MIYITGDTHADKTRFSAPGFRKTRVHPKKGDTILVCGDFGFIWDASENEKKLLAWLGKRPYHILFVAGTHENFHLLEQYPESDFAGGRARTISGNLRLLSNGHLFTIEDKKIFAFGGGESEDALLKKETNTWYEQELPGLDQIEHGRKALEENGCGVDFIVTHDAPTKIRRFLCAEITQMNEMHAFFDWIFTSCRFERWFFGKYHMDRKIASNMQALYQAVIPIVPPQKKKRGK